MTSLKLKLFNNQAGYQFGGLGRFLFFLTQRKFFLFLFIYQANILQEEEKPVTSGDNDSHDIPDNLLTKLLAIEMETLDTEKERINKETQPETEGEIFIMREKF